MKIIAGGGVNCWTATHTHACGVATARFAGVVTDRAVIEFWLRPHADAVILFDYRIAVIAYRSPVCLTTLQAQRAGPPGAILCDAKDYELFTRRADALAVLGVRRMVLLDPALAQEWATQQARRSLAKSSPRRRAQDVRAAQHLLSC